MFIIYDPHKQRLPINVWLDNINELDDACYQQALQLSNLPFAYERIVLLPDTHVGFGMPIGGVLATKNTIVPNAVGVDIGCGMIFTQTNIPAKVLSALDLSKGVLAQMIIDRILKRIPTGFAHHKEVQVCQSVNSFLDKLGHHPLNQSSKDLQPELERARYQVGTLGGGNHFIELQINEEGFIGIMIHSGSRNIGYKICNYFNEQFKEENQKSQSSVPLSWDLAHLPADSPLGKQYITWMKFAMEFAKENRLRMMELVTNIVYDMVRGYGRFLDITFSDFIDCHHNYAALEEHKNNMVWVHRKGAIKALMDEPGIIPGAMGSYSYIVKGKGNPESFYSCSHGAGRVMSRKKAKMQFDVHATITDLQEQGVYLGKVKKGDVGEESRFAYKNIEEVINHQLDLIEPISKLKTLAVIKG
jgi:tRNA-splicing ligase RtcB (3'-phosphate/5'-hydroxy nucleic acid ligase)